MKKDIVSIITTCYNAVEYIEYCIGSIAPQHTDDTFSIEYIIVNDASTDNSLDMIYKTINHYKNHNLTNDIEFKIYTLEENVGCGAARKYGISKATGNYIMFLDADDYYFNSDFVLRAHNDIIENNADIVDYGIKYNQTDGQSFLAVVQNKIEFTSKSDKIVAMFRDNLIKFHVWSKIYTRQIVDSFPYSETRTFEDIRTVPIWVYNANKVVIMPSLEINYRSNPTSIIHEDGLSTRIGTCTAICEMMEYFKDDFNSLKACYNRAMIDLDATLNGHTSKEPGFNEMSELNTKMLSYIYPDKYKELTFNITEQ